MFPLSDEAFHKWLNDNIKQIEQRLIKIKEKEDPMCERCHVSKKDPADYITVSNGSCIEFIKTHDGKYYRSKNIRHFSVRHSALTDQYGIYAYEEKEGMFIIENFKSHKEAEEFLKELIEDHIGE